MDIRTLKGSTLSERMADMHRRNAVTFRRLAQTETRPKWHAKLLAAAEVAERLARMATS